MPRTTTPDEPRPVHVTLHAGEYVLAMRDAAALHQPDPPRRTHPNWETLTPELVPLDRIVFPCHDLDPAHVHGPVDQPYAVHEQRDPVHLEQLLDGAYFVHDGRHRVLRARAAGHARIAARVHRHA